ncbi:hypothetical protein BT93_I1064 [Corymbia citriodora subsp. variegata]|nr:hypothetical protein BT93_I1064 [Corymbia citriodora subsp. variegata]
MPAAAAAASRSRGALKHKRGNSSSSRSLFKSLGPDEQRNRIASLEAEIQGVLAYCREMMERRELVLDSSSAECGSANGAIACCLEESASPLSRLVGEVYAKLNEGNAGGGGLTVASVKSGAVFVGQRVMYSVPNADADVLEDDSPSSL